jgi:hypothetical protein
MVTVKVTIAPGVAYCDEESFCDSDSHFAIRDQSGKWLNLTPTCSPLCDGACIQPPCPGAACIRSGMAYLGEQRVWSGGHIEHSTCGASIQCYRERFVPPGRYVAVACATPGTVEWPDGGANNPQCKKTGDRECAEVAFDLPSSGPVELVLGLSSSRDR